MIVYESNKNWGRDLGHLFRSWTMKRVMAWTLVVCAITAILCVLFIEILPHINIVMEISIFSLLGVVLSILMGFRTNTAYDRWWEGRKAWGDLVNNTRNLAIYVNTAFPPDDHASRRYIAVRITNFCLALKEHLRKGANVDELIHLEESEKAAYRTKNHVPAHIAMEIAQRIQDAYRVGAITDMDHLNIKAHTQSLMNIAGICERIRKTPIPFSYNVYLKFFVSVYAILLPFELIPAFGYASILIVGFVFFAFVGLELMAEEIEDPFGLDCNDLPLGDISNTIRRNVFELMNVTDEQPAKQSGIYEKVF